MTSHRHPRPTVVVSKCLGFDHCRYDGDISHCDLVQRLRKRATIITVCPEIEIGLGIPRDKIRLVPHGNHIRLIQPATGRQLTTVLREFSRKFLSELKDVDGFILKSHSPSCGIRDTKIFKNGTDDDWTVKGTGIFASEVLKRFDGCPVEDEIRLRNKNTRKRFLTRLFKQAAHRQGVILSQPIPPNLIEE